MNKRAIEEISKRQNDILVKLNKKPNNDIITYNGYILSTVVMSILALIFMVDLKENSITVAMLIGIAFNGVVILCNRLKRSLG